MIATPGPATGMFSGIGFTAIVYGRAATHTLPMVVCPDYVNLGDTSRGLAKQALMRLSPKSFAIFRKLGLEQSYVERRADHSGDFEWQ